ACSYALPSRWRSAETPDRRGREETPERFDERVTSGDWLAAGGAFAAQQEPRCDRNVLERGDLVSARGALRTRHDEVIRRPGRRRLITMQLGALLGPSAFEHLRHAMDDDVQKAADAKPHDRRHGNGDVRIDSGHVR